MIGKRTSTDIFIYITLLVVVITTAIFNHTVVAQTETDQKLTTELSGVNEVPPTNSSSTGLAEFDILGTDIFDIMLMPATYRMLLRDIFTGDSKERMDLYLSNCSLMIHP